MLKVIGQFLCFMAASSEEGYSLSGFGCESINFCQADGQLITA
jgi:hypothetical protein